MSSLELNQDQLGKIRTFAEAGHYFKIYEYIASEMRAGSIKGATSDQIF